MFDSVDYLIKSGKINDLTKGRKVYGEGVGDKFINKINELMKENKSLFTWAHQALGFKDEDTNSGFL